MQSFNAISLTAVPYGESGRIVKLFTKELGIISFIIKRMKKKDKHLHCISSPLLKGEYIVHQGRGELFSFRDATICDQYMGLRREYSRLMAANAVLNALNISQMPHKPAPLLFAMTHSYLQRLCSTKAPENLLHSFLLKLLIHEGLFDPQNCRDFQQTSLFCTLSQSKRFSEIEEATSDQKTFQLVNQLFKQNYYF